MVGNLPFEMAAMTHTEPGDLYPVKRMAQRPSAPGSTEEREPLIRSRTIGADDGVKSRALSGHRSVAATSPPGPAGLAVETAEDHQGRHEREASHRNNDRPDSVGHLAGRVCLALTHGLSA